METSDSECFESADEEFPSDNELDPPKKLTTVSLEPKEVERLSITEDNHLSVANDSNVSRDRKLPNPQKTINLPPKRVELEKSSTLEDRDSSIKSDNSLSYKQTITNLKPVEVKIGKSSNFDALSRTTDSKSSKKVSGFPFKAIKKGKLNITKDKKSIVTVDNVSCDKKLLESNPGLTCPEKIHPPSKVENVAKGDDVNNDQSTTHSSSSNIIDAHTAPSVQSRSDNKPEQKGKIPRSTLGVKLGTKIKTNLDSSESDNTVATPPIPACTTESVKHKVKTEIKPEPENVHDFKVSKTLEEQEEDLWDDDDWEPNANFESLKFDKVASPSKSDCTTESVKHQGKTTIKPQPKNGQEIKDQSKTSEEQEENLWDDDDWEPNANFDSLESDKVAAPTKSDCSTEWVKLKVKTEVKPEPENVQVSKTLEEQEEDMWGDDDWEPITDVASTPNKKDEDFNSDWSGWGNWGVNSLISTATMGVTTIKNHVSQGLNTVLESGIGAPDPEELARLHMAENKVEEIEGIKTKDRNVVTSPDLTFGLGSFVSGVSQITKLVETTGNKVISSGLDTLETIGKKTMQVLQEGDPGLKKKRAFLKIESDKPVLSQILREAKEKAEYENKLLEEQHYSRKANYETLFDDHQGLVHLEALEMLSRQCDIKLQTMLEHQSGGDLTETQETLNQIKELCELPDEEDESTLPIDEIEEKLKSAPSEMNIPISYNKLFSTWVESEQWLDNLNLNICNEMELYEQSINIMAQLTAIAVELFHKTGAYLLIKDHRSTVDEADCLVQLTATMTILISIAARKMTAKLNEKASQSANKDKINGLITNVYYEATNSSSYIKNAFQLLVPVIQVGAV